MRIVGGLVAACLLLAACGQTNGQVIDTYKPQVEALRAKVIAIIDRLPPPGKVQRTAQFSGQPQLYYDEKAEDYWKRSNIDFVPLEKLKGEAVAPHDFSLSSIFEASLEWVSDRYYYRDARDEGFDKSFADALDTRFVGVYREVAYTKSKLIDDKTFEPGSLTLEVIVIDLSDEAVIAACTISGEPGDEVSVSRQADEATWDEYKLADSTHTQMLYQAWGKLGPCLTKQTGGRFDFRTL
jgi:hypothetical protein